MITLACDPNNLEIVNNVASCSSWMMLPVDYGFWGSMTNQEFSDFLAACIKLGFSAFFVWWLVWAARRM